MEPIYNSPAQRLILIGASQDRRLRAIDTATGKILWSAPLPDIGAVPPMSYIARKSGRQHVVIAAGHHSEPGGSGPPDTLLAYALPPAADASAPADNRRR